MKHIFNLEPYNLNIEQKKKLFGDSDYIIKEIEKTFDISILSNGTSLIYDFEDENIISQIDNIFIKLIQEIKNNNEIDKMVLNNLISSSKDKLSNHIDNKYQFVTTYNNKVIRPLNSSQLLYLKLLEENTIVFAMGAAGSGKTFLAVAYAIKLLKLKKVKRIVITRPIVEAGENLGFLPGELKEKVDPYLTPIYDALNSILGVELTNKYIESKVIEIAPLAYMRGRTLSDACIILDEAQNTTTTQMKMFLTRLGYNAKMIVTGDETQIDLNKKTLSGFIDASQILLNIKGIEFIKFNASDVIRHPLVSKIIQAYDK